MSFFSISSSLLHFFQRTTQLAYSFKRRNYCIMRIRHLRMLSYSVRRQRRESKMAFSLFPLGTTITHRHTERWLPLRNNKSLPKTWIKSFFEKPRCRCSSINVNKPSFKLNSVFLPYVLSNTVWTLYLDWFDCHLLVENDVFCDTSKTVSFFL